MRDAGVLDLNTRQKEKHLLRMLKRAAGVRFFMIQLNFGRCAGTLQMQKRWHLLL